MLILLRIMENKEYIKPVELIKEYLAEQGINVSGLFLFGSRARGDNNPDSDYDLMIVVDKDFQQGEKRKLVSKIYKHLIENDSVLNIDLVIKPIEYYNWESQNIGFLSYSVKKEGILV